MAARIRRVIGVGILVLIIAFVSAASLLRPPRPRPAEAIRITDGLVQGMREAGLTIYRGIPYAAAPTGELRWRPPQIAAPWKGVLKADVFKPACPQIGPTVPGMSVEPTNEDCLYLNIWTSDGRPTSRLPVMIWLHGGNNTHGSGSAQLYRGDELAKKGVLVVTFNYRLGALGMLAHPELSKESEHGVSGNYLLLDQIALLRWVQRNITAFGGDPHNMTLFGQSAGAYNISKLIVSPLAKGLFQRAIAESGGDLGPVDSAEGPVSLAAAQRTGIAFADYFGVTSMAELRQIPADEIIAAPLRDIRLNVDGYVSPKDSYQLYQDGEQQPVDLLLGYTASDGALAPGPSAGVFTDDIHKKYADFSGRFLAVYPAATDEQARRSWRRLETEEGFAWESVTWARLNRLTAGHETFLYVFSHVPPFGPYPKAGAAHGAELAYVFGTVPGVYFYAMENPLRAYRDNVMVHDIQTYWTNFAKTGDPNGEGVPAWPLFDARERVLDIGDTLRATDLPHADEYELMNAYIASLRNHPIQDE